MKKIIVFAIILAITAAALMLNVTVSAEEDNFNFARIFASGGDPYLYVHFSGGKSIDPDSTQWTAIKYRSGAKNDGAVIEVYASSPTAPGSNDKLVSDGKWNIVVFNVKDAGNWNGEDYGDKTRVRIDPFDGKGNGSVKTGSYIDIAWAAFFKTEADAKAYTGEQNTPECIALPEDFVNAVANNDVAQISGIENITDKKDIAPVDSEGYFNYAYIVMSGDDPHFYAKFNNYKVIDADSVKWASIKYRSEPDNEGNYMQIYAYSFPIEEPCKRYDTKNTGDWVTDVISLEGTANWNSDEYIRPNTVRIDPLNEKCAYNGAILEIAWIAFFSSEEQAKAYDGTQLTPDAIILPEDILSASTAIDQNHIGSVDIFEDCVNSEEATTEDPETEESKTEDSAENTETEESKAEDSVENTETGETGPEETKHEGSEPEETKDEETKSGDVNGDNEVNNKDVVDLFRYASSGDHTAEKDAKYDINSDGEVNNKDVVELFRSVSVKN
ncbi:MAG: hypothetical protein IJT49_04365 [Clostridia bacterium]|nr:hypothetical protein [Clostridia bacterium]